MPARKAQPPPPEEEKGLTGRVLETVLGLGALAAKLKEMRKA